jgi:hypothetical protein
VTPYASRGGGLYLDFRFRNDWLVPAAS